MFQDEAIARLTKKAQNKDLKEGEMLISEPCVCKSNAGYYIGRWCVEMNNNILFPQPYSRDSDYMTKRDAEDHFN